MFTNYPWLNLPGVKQFVEYILNVFEAKVVLELQRTSGMVVFFVSEDQNAKAANLAADNLKKVQRDPNSNSVAKRKAAQDFESAYTALIRFSNDSPDSNS